MRFAIIASATVLLTTAGPVSAHEIAGMNYTPYKMPDGVTSCCNDQDCSPVSDFVETTDAGKPVVRLQIEGKWITVDRKKVVAEDANDGRAHWCGKMDHGGYKKSQPVTYCIILPPRGT
jgi:hypothetical protein